MNKKELDNQINQALSGWEIPNKQSKKAIWQSVFNETVAKKTTVRTISTWRWVAAASTVAIIASFALFYTAQVTISSSNSQTSFLLPDGSSLTLNAASTASYNSLTWILTRSVELSGEGFFKVKKGSQFSVNTQHGTVSVLGTSFNVIAKPHTFIIECFTGKVAINNGKNKVVIKKGETIIQLNSLSLHKEVSNQGSPAPQWLNDTYTYQNEKLKNVLNDISNHFGVELNASNKVNKLSFTGKWDKKMLLDDVLKIICMPFNLEATLVNDKEYEIGSIE